MTKNNHKWIKITIYGYFMLRYTMKNNIMYIRKYNESFLLDDSHVILESPMCASTLDSIYYAAMFLEEYRFQYISALEEPRQIQWNRRADAESLEAVPTDCPL